MAGAHDAVEIASEGARRMGNPNIKSSKITVGAGKVPFPKWYNEVHLKQHAGMHPIFKDRHKYPAIDKHNNFAVVFDQVKLFHAPELTINEFIAFFMIFCNETGGTFVPIVEHGTPEYFFSKGAHKASYNHLGANRKAGDLLKARGILKEPDDAAEIKAWNGDVWPKDSKDEVKKASHECDYYKFRGRGLAQVTGHEAYVKTVDPVLGKGKSDALTDAELTDVIRKDPKIYLGMVKHFFSSKNWQGWIAGVNKNPAEWIEVGYHISGSRNFYGKLYEWRCQTLLDAMVKEGYDAT
jgi:hypothetical protein